MQQTAAVKLRHLLVLAGLAGLVLPVTGCSPGLQPEALELRDALRDLPGVERMDLDYVEAGFREGARFRSPATVDLDGRMVEDSTPEAVVDVFVTAYEELRTTHGGEAGFLRVARGDDLIELRTTDPRPDADAVAEAVERALSVTSLGRARVFVTAGPLEDSPTPGFYDVLVSAAPGVDAATRLLRSLETVEALHRGRPQDYWSVSVDGGRRGMSTSGFPSREARALLADLAEGLPAEANLSLYGRDPDVRVGADMAPDAVVDLATRHLRRLGGVARATYRIGADSETIHVQVARGECQFGESPAGVLLRAEIGDACTVLSGPDSTTGPDHEIGAPADEG